MKDTPNSSEGGQSIEEETRKQKMDGLFAEYNELRKENNRLVQESMRVEGTRLNMYTNPIERVRERMIEIHDKDQEINKRLMQIHDRQEEIHKEQMGLSEGEDLKVLFQNWAEENGVSRDD